MGLCIFCDENAPIPRRTTLVLTCDGKHRLPPRAVFKSGNHVADWSKAMKLGWLERYISVRPYRIFLCPKCSGKKPKNSA